MDHPRLRLSARHRAAQFLPRHGMEGRPPSQGRAGDHLAALRRAAGGAHAAGKCAGAGGAGAAARVRDHGRREPRQGTDAGEDPRTARRRPEADPGEGQGTAAPRGVRSLRPAARPSPRRARAAQWRSGDRRRRALHGGAADAPARAAAGHPRRGLVPRRCRTGARDGSGAGLRGARAGPADRFAPGCARRWGGTGSRASRGARAFRSTPSAACSAPTWKRPGARARTAWR